MTTASCSMPVPWSWAEAKTFKSRLTVPLLVKMVLATLAATSVAVAFFGQGYFPDGRRGLGIQDKGIVVGDKQVDNRSCPGANP